MKFFKRKNTENKQESTQKKANLKEIIDGTVLTKDVVVKQIPFILFLMVVAILYIANRYQSEKIVRETLTVQRDIKELRSEAISTASELMFISKQSEVIKLIEKYNLGLKESTVPPKKLKLEF